MSDILMSAERLAETVGVYVAVGGFESGERATEMSIARTPSSWVMMLGEYTGRYDAHTAEARLGTVVPGATLGLFGSGEVVGTAWEAVESFNSAFRKVGGTGELVWLDDFGARADAFLRKFKSDGEDIRRKLRGKAMSLAYRDGLGCLLAIGDADKVGMFALQSQRRAVGMLASCIRRMTPADLRAFRRAAPCRWSRMVDAEEAARKNGLEWAAEVDGSGNLMVAVGKRSVGVVEKDQS